MGTLAILALAAAAQSPDSERTQLLQLNQDLARAATFSLQPDQLAAQLNRRAALLIHLMDSEPGQISTFALPPGVVAQARRLLTDPALESYGEWSGSLEAAIADDFEHHSSRTFWYLQTATRKLRIHPGAAVPRSPGVQVKVVGLEIGGHLAASQIVPQSLETAAALACSPLGQQKIAVLMLNTPSYTLPSGVNASSLQQTFFGSQSDSVSTASLNGMWKEMSYGRTSAAGQVFGPFSLPADVDCNQADDITTAAVKAADSAVDFSQYTHVALFFPVASCSAYAGMNTIGCSTISSPSKGTVNTTVGWFPETPGNTPSVGLLAHELGHGLGLGHSSSDAYSGEALGALGTSGTLVEYGDVFSLMGYPYNGAGMSGQYTGEHKSLLQWLTPGEYQEVTATGTYTLRPFESTANPRALRVLRDPISGAWIWLEFRQPLGDIDPALGNLSGTNVFQGAIVHYEDPTLDSGHAYLLDFKPESPANFNNAALAPGSPWSDPYSLLTLSVSNPSTSGLTVNVSYDSPCATLQPSPTTFDAAGGGGSVTVTAPSGCSWTASTAVTWIHLTGVTSGQGNGVVTFTVDGYSGAAQRSGYLTVQRQSVLIQQRGSAPAIVGVSPNIGSGASAQFTVTARDLNGYTDINEVELMFSGSPGCSIYLFSSYLYLGSDSWNWLGPIYYNSPGSTLSNSSCSVSTSGASWTGAGNQLQATVSVNFLAAFGGSHRISALAAPRNSTGSVTAIPSGMWTVPTTKQTGFTVTATAAGAPFTVDNGSVYQAPATFYFPANSQHTITWLSSAPGVTNSRYVFQGWTDSSTANPRTFTVPSTDVTYNANIQAQYQITTAVVPTGSGTITLSPPSADGFYDAGTTVTVTAVPATGYGFNYFSGTDTWTNPQQLVMSSARSITGQFYCSYRFPGWLPNQVGPGALTGLIVWTAGAGCQATAASDSPWLSLGAQSVSNGFNVVPFSITKNTGASRSGTVTLSGDTSATMQTVQSAAGTEGPTVVSVSPSSGNASTQAFTLQIRDPAGYGDVLGVYFNIRGNDDHYCNIFMYFGGSPYVGMGADGATWQTLYLPSGGVIQNDKCIVSGAASSFSGAGNNLTVTFGLTFASAFAGPRVLSAYAYSANQAVIAEPALGTWMVPAVQPHSLTIGANLAGAPFLLDEKLAYQAPVTFYFLPGEQHTIRWLTALPNTTDSRYTFQNWTDLSTANPRTFTTPTADITYTANVSAQFQLSIGASPAAGGTVSATPASSDGFYDAGQEVTLTAAPASGFSFWYFIVDSSGYTPSAVTMDAPHRVTAIFQCQLTFAVWPPSQVGAAAISGTLIWTMGQGCQTSLTGDSPWLTLGAQTMANGFHTVPYTIAGNTGSTARTANISFTGDYAGSMQLTQDAAGSARPNIVSLSPNSGNAGSQIFTLQIVDSTGYAHVSSVGLAVGPNENRGCYISIYGLASPNIYLYDGGAGSAGPLNLPGNGTIENNFCQVKGETSSVSGVGNSLTVKLDVTFKVAFAGSHAIAAWAYADNYTGGGSEMPLGTWTVSFGPPALSLTKSADAATVAAGSPVGFTLSASNSATAGTGTATNAVLTDALPAASGLNWTISPTYSGPGTCGITGLAGSQTLSCSLGSFALGAAAAVHVTSATVPANCGTYTNTASLSADNVTPAKTASAGVTVQCPNLAISGPNALPTGALGTPYFATTITATGGTGVYSWSATGLPPGLSIGAVSGIVSGTPTSLSGSPYSADIAVSDGLTIIHRTYPITIYSASPCDVDGDTHLTLGDVQRMVKEVFGIQATHDVNGDHAINVVDLQIVVSAAGGQGCGVY